MILLKQLTPEQSLVEHSNLVARLYSTKKPNAINVKMAINNLAIFSNGEVQAVASLFSNNVIKGTLMVGNYECINDDGIAQFLFNAISKLANQMGLTTLIGPMHGDTWNSYRYSLLPKSPFFMEYIHQAYYINQWQKFGFSIWAKYQTNIENIDSNFHLDNAASYFDSKGLCNRPFNIDQPIEDLKKIHAFCSNVFVNNFLYSPISQDDFIAMYTPLLPFLKPALIDIVTQNDEIVGLLFAIDNLYATNEVIVKTIARDLSDEYKGLAHHMAANFQFKARKLGYETMLHAYFHVANKSSRVSENYNGQLYQQHILLKKELL